MGTAPALLAACTTTARGLEALGHRLCAPSWAPTKGAALLIISLRWLRRLCAKEVEGCRGDTMWQLGSSGSCPRPESAHLRASILASLLGLRAV